MQHVQNMDAASFIHMALGCRCNFASMSVCGALVCLVHVCMYTHRLRVCCVRVCMRVYTACVHVYIYTCVHVCSPFAKTLL